jgi:hypothetical protein
VTIKDPNHVHLDVFKIVSNQIMIGVNNDHGIIYNSKKLGDVGEAYGYGGKLEELTGVDAIAKRPSLLLIWYY